MTGCPSDDSYEVVVRPYSEVYAEDIVKIETFLDTHFTTVDADYNVTFTKITADTPSATPISDALDTSANQDDPSKKLKHKIVSVGGVDHKLYFLKLREGSGNTNVDSDNLNDNPTKLDSIYCTYKGIKTDLSTFASSNSPSWLLLEQPNPTDILSPTIKAWHEIFPLFKRGNFVFDSNTGTTTFSDFGAGVMFVPSGLAYFNQINTGIPAYSPLIFSFKLMNIRYRDHDGDKLLSKDEYGGPATGTALDSDGDGKPDYGEYDDDNDGKVTFEEIRRTPGVSRWYPFKGAAVDDPATLDIDERQGIPSCSGDYTSPNRLRRHLDSSCK